MHWTA
jgi:hypothetical protein